MITIQNLHKQYDDKTVLHGVSLHVDRGEIHGLLGISGAGKSTLLRCVNGLERYDSGTLMVRGQEVGALPKRAMRDFRKYIGVIFQDFALLERKTALENVMLPLECWHCPASQKRDKALNMLRLVGIDDKAACLPRELSGGQKQRVGIARALVMEPEILLCDEATSALDPMTTLAVLQLLKDINIKMRITMLVVTHQLEVVKFLCNRMSIMENGTLAVSGDTGAIFQDQPEALQRLAGTPQAAIPAGMTGLRVSVGPEHFDEPLFSQLSLDTQAAYTMIFAQTDMCASGKIGQFYLAVAPQDAPGVIHFFQQRAIDCRTITP